MIDSKLFHLSGLARAAAARFKHRRARPLARTATRCAQLALLLPLLGCAVELQNLEPARAYAASSQDPSSAYVGWRVFEQRCASCHGHSAAGMSQGPDLLPRMSTMGPRRFVDWVLRRYEWDIPDTPANSEVAALNSRVDQILKREGGALTMPAWQGDPQVNAHILDLYAYLAARAEGSQGPGRPKP